MIKIFYKGIASNYLCRDTQIVSIKNGSEGGEHAHEELYRGSDVSDRRSEEEKGQKIIPDKSWVPTPS